MAEHKKLIKKTLIKTTKKNDKKFPKARAVALTAFQQVVRQGAFAQVALRRALEVSSHLSRQDVSFVTDLLYGALRHYSLLVHVVDQRLKRPHKLPHIVYDALVLASYDLLIRETPDFAGVNEWVNIIKKQQPRLAGLSNAVLRRIELPSSDDKSVSMATRLGVPQFLYDEWLEMFDAQTAVRIVEGMNEPEPLWVTVLLHNVSLDKILQSLEAQKCEVRKGLVAGSLALRAPVPLGQLEAFQKGWLQPQNPSSRLPVQIMNVAKGNIVLDLASGNGIKAAQLLEQGARVTSVELVAEKIARAKQNLSRLGFTGQNHQHVIHDLTKSLTDKVEIAPYVLLDAPCSGTGTLRGNPEIRQRVTEKAIIELADLQRIMLHHAAAVCAVGGILVYAVCALTIAEGEGNSSWFLAEHPNFVPASFEVKVETCNIKQASSSYGKYILPIDGLDGFYIAMFSRKS